jgi:predicted cupin superfamily sugar epimerase
VTVGADAYIEALGLEAHPEGGWFCRTWTHPQVDDDGRALASSIHYLLSAGERSHWHRIDAAETWLWHAGGPLRLATWIDGDEAVGARDLGPDPLAGQVPQLTVPAGAWQAAEPLGAFALVSCVVVPAFRFEGFELAPPGWRPPAA